MTWLSKERNVPPGLKVVDWKPAADSSGWFGWLSQALGNGVWPFGRAVCRPDWPNLGHPQA